MDIYTGKPQVEIMRFKCEKEHYMVVETKRQKSLVDVSKEKGEDVGKEVEGSGKDRLSVEPCDVMVKR